MNLAMNSMQLVLIIEPDTVVREQFRATLRAVYQVVMADNLREGITKLQNQMPLQVQKLQSVFKWGLMLCITTKL